ncbi:MAG: SHOCT domain-containing protein [Chloroflexota bacterium]|nr:SHOCT domain-containing protein [Chloroflexota bacterium]
MMMGFGFFGLLFMLIFWVGLIFGAIWLVRYLFQTNQPPSMSPQSGDLNPQEILEQRYTRGEITREQFETMKQDLSN